MLLNYEELKFLSRLNVIIKFKLLGRYINLLVVVIERFKNSKRGIFYMKSRPSKIADTEAIKNSFYRLLEEIVPREKHRFSGLGLLVYDSMSFDDLNSLSLRPSNAISSSLFLVLDLEL